MVAPPCWTDPIDSARRYAGPSLARGLDVRPVLFAFEDGEPTLLVRAGPAWGDRDRHRSTRELVALVPVLGVPQLLIVSGGRTTDPSIDDPELRDASAERCVLVESAERTTTGELSGAAHLLPYRVLDDGTYRWVEPVTVPGAGPWAPPLHEALRRRGDHDVAMAPAEMAYGLSRRGVAVAVAPGWRVRYGFDAPLPPGTVRPVDRARARRLAAGGAAGRTAGRAS